jgi:biopolymer transport protein ExbB/TolQ
MNETLREALHVVTENLENPAIILRLATMVLVVVLVGETVVEWVLTRKHRKIVLPQVVLELGAAKTDPERLEVLEGKPFSKAQLAAFRRVLDADADAATRRTLAVQALLESDVRADRLLFLTKVVSRIGPMMGLMATLIPLGPGLQALGEGDPQGLSSAMLMAFDATVIGLASAIVAFIIFELKKTWYKSDLNATEIVLEEVTQ